MKKARILLLCLLVVLTACAPVKVDSAQPPVKVYYAGAENTQMGVKAALDLAEQSGTIALVSDPAQAEAYVLNGVVPAEVGAIVDLEAGRE